MIKLIFVGSGVSCAIPVIGHLNNGDACVCKDATEHPEGPNKRNNVSMLIQLPRGASTAGGNKADASRSSPFTAHALPVNVLIDCGKTFRDAYFRVLASRGVRHVDVLLLTHGHADAMQCVEELAELHTATLREVVREGTQDTLPVSLRHALAFIPTYLTQPTLREVQDVAPQLVDASRHWGTAPRNRTEYLRRLEAYEKNPDPDHQVKSHEVTPTSSSALDLFLVAQEAPAPLYMEALHGDDNGEANIPFYSLPVDHGKDYISLGYVFGRGTVFKTPEEEADEAARQKRRDELKDRSCVVYISDVNEIIPAALAFLTSLVKIDVLVFDLLAEKGRSSPSHTCWDDCMPVIRQLTPTKTFFVGMFCSLEHHRSNALWKEDLAAERANVEAALAAAESGSAMLEVERTRLRRFLNEVESAELAYDGMELSVPL